MAAGFTLLTYPLIYLFEKIFGYISDVTLLELSDTNNGLLRELNLKAPGTFQHSLQVSNLAEEGIREIGGNPLLVRAGALYHDIGKMMAPAYFIENQSGVNPHDELGYEESAGIIIDHVIRGIELAKEHKLPEQIIDFIRTHHGTTKTQYFLRMFKNENPDEEVPTELFQYPGPIPYSKETAVLMMADSVEAASRSLKIYDNDSITKLVEGIINSQVAENQFINTNITFNDVTVIKKMFIKKLMNIYHVRIEYPK
jgi:putative nucleotidyltransferase with HDIG domain